jgi:hypothetical protein
MPAITPIPVRKVIEPPLGKDGLFIQPSKFGPERELVEAHNRTRFANKFNLADPWTGNTRTYDPLGRYNCGRCNEADDNVCVEVSESEDSDQAISIDREAGSCKDWEDLCAGDPEVRLTRSRCTNKTLVGYAVSAVTNPNGKGFGCWICPFASEAYEADSKGRDLYCGKGDFRTMGTVCCQLNGAPVVSEKKRRAHGVNLLSKTAEKEK